ncbi:MAG: IS66 family insertion sequence element accessory protein TnpB [Saprospiraceae bacterium]|nr:IS66 family insertion sequence element accessory protein TnpB [Saprospiraceae bacterium]
MFALSSAQRYFLYRGVTDMRKGIDGLSGMVREYLGSDPLSGDAYVFVNRRRDQLKLLIWDRTGFALYAKRLERGTFELPEQREGVGARQAVRWDELVMILEGVSLRSIQRRRRYQRGEEEKKQVLAGRTN